MFQIVEPLVNAVLCPGVWHEDTRVSGFTVYARQKPDNRWERCDLEVKSQWLPSCGVSVFDSAVIVQPVRCEDAIPFARVLVPIAVNDD